MGLRMKNLIFLGLTEKSDFYEGGGGGHKKPIYRGDCLKWEACTVCRFKEFLTGGVDTPTHTMIL